jgi:hypothetical protein
MQLAEDRLAEISKDVLETMAFALVLPEAAPPAAPGEPVVRVAVDFAGPLAGQVTLAMPASTMAELAGNMAAGQSAQPADAVGELCNIICGNLLPAVAGDTAVFDLRAPRTLPPDPADQPLAPADQPSPGQSVTARLALDTGWVEVTLAVRPAA